MSAFLTEFKKLLLENPRYHLKIVNSENCDYADTAVNSKDGYYSFGLFHGDRVLYSRYSRNGSNCSDLTFCFDMEWSYECIGCSKGYGLQFCKYCSNSSNLWFSEDCHGSKNLFGCIGLQQKQYYFLMNPFRKKIMKNDFPRWI
ncbi:hypothetical protein IPJ72_00500 [Candidatus Peregrinibacteria bacterium]|nr:MAG: hypothetical protein IPJ72_00500 [Candidatus Peregrinibacteria bacterium]